MCITKLVFFLLLEFTFFKALQLCDDECYFRPGGKESGSVLWEMRCLKSGSQAHPKPLLYVQLQTSRVCAGHRRLMVSEWQLQQMWTHQHISLSFLSQQFVLGGVCWSTIGSLDNWWLCFLTCEENQSALLFSFLKDSVR